MDGNDWITEAQAELQALGLAAWLLYDFRGSNRLAQPFLGLGHSLSRRVFLLVPPSGQPTLLVHAIERGSLPELPYRVESYSSRQSLEAALAQLVPRGRVAMEYSPKGDIPYLAQVDAGTVELVRSLGAEVVSSGELLQRFGAWRAAQLAAHREAARHVLAAKDLAFEMLALRVHRGEAVRETEVQRLIASYFANEGLETGHPAIVAFGPHAGDPHYAPGPGRDAALQPGDAILIDLWAKLPGPENPYADITWMGACGQAGNELRRVWEVVKGARELAVDTIRAAYRAGRHPEGREIDRAAREFIAAAGYGEAFIHRTGHSLGTRATHGDAAHLDDFETRDTRLLRPGLGVTIEPGVYLEAFGVRSEIDLYLAEDGPEVTTEAQLELIVLPLP